MVNEAFDRIPSNKTCVVIPLTVIYGPKSGLTRVYCTCGWDQNYKSRKKAFKRANEHIELTGKARGW